MSLLLRSVVWLLLPLITTAAFAERSSLEQEVFEAETAFAKTMADRDFQAFTTFLAEDAVFLNQRGALRGKAAIAAAWKPLFEAQQAPFSWLPETVAVIGAGDIALSTGPVRNEAGEIFAYFTSTWRKAKDGKWQVILDKGQKYCPPDKPADTP